MAHTEPNFGLRGRILITGSIHTATGLHIGGARTARALSALENAVARDALTQRPYIPGSSLKGKLRSLLEKHYNKSQQWTQGGVRIHVCYRFDEKGERVPDPEAYKKCEVCPLFGTPARFAVLPTRLTVRDVPLDESSAATLSRARTDLPFTEVKGETALDRVTAAATPRQVERVPAGAVFAPMEMVLNVYEQADLSRLLHLLDALHLLEDDYLGGLGSRGSGRVVFQGLSLTARSRDNYAERRTFVQEVSLKELVGREDELLEWLRTTLPV